MTKAVNRLAFFTSTKQSLGIYGTFVIKNTATIKIGSIEKGWGGVGIEG